MGKILIVEDNEIICDCLKSLVKSVDPSQDVYSTGYAGIALEYAQNNAIDVFLLDIELLDYSGTILAEKIRKIDAYKMSPIIFITSDAKLELEAYRNAQCYKFITKPFKSEEVKETLKTVIQHGIKAPVAEEKLLLKQKGYTISVFQKDILYFESRNRKLLAVTIHEEIEISKHTLGGILAEVNKEFFQCHKGFIINSSWIYCVDKTQQLIMLRENRGSVPYGEKYKDRLAGVWL